MLAYTCNPAQEEQDSGSKSKANLGVRPPPLPTPLLSHVHTCTCTQTHSFLEQLLNVGSSLYSFAFLALLPPGVLLSYQACISSTQVHSLLRVVGGR